MSEAVKPVKIDKWDGSAVKNALDDGVKKILNENYGFKENFYYMNIRLILCTIAVLFAAFCCLWDFLNPFPKSRPVIIMSVIAYFILTTILSVFVMAIEKNKVYVGYSKDRAGVDPDDQWIVSTNMKRFDDKYYISMTFKDGCTHKERTEEATKCVADFFNEEGELCLDLYTNFISGMKEKLKASDELKKKSN